MSDPRKRKGNGPGSAPKRLQRDDTVPLVPKHPANGLDSKRIIIVKNLDRNCDALELLRLFSSEKAGAGNAKFLISFKTNIASIQIPLDAQDKTKVSTPSVM